ncbi:phosphotransferase enzyme family domain-containing protein [Trichoderma breve]|uniref:Phosphotransferase enzyme family domain-containing protein n=1 Tax=Trichoderma breve TaxID=2034170 RepID=A0A9W9B6E6_9HYPO|nr:phosphotransferase enzyme family domain-containing protein [Trichoderma breve]KAJ4854610.1 phosphotransferase enzyme family domain-containing protein [Trichoderma breve]
MLRALIHSAYTLLTLSVLYLLEIWGRLLHSFYTADICAPNTPEFNIPKIKNSGKGTFNTQNFPDATEDQVNEAKRTFIESLDLHAICDLASRYNNGKSCRVVSKKNGSFNVCFFVEFDHDGSKWTVRIPIEAAQNSAWEKLESEVATIRYLERNTKIPVPHVRAYGRDAKLSGAGLGTQMYLITDFIPGEPLDKKLLIKTEEKHRLNFYSQLIDILAELRKLEFPLIGSLIPTSEGSQGPVLGPVISMTATTLQLPPTTVFTSARQYMKYQFSLVSALFLPPVADHTINEVKKEVFALHGIMPLFDQFIDPDLDYGPFVLSHLDLRSCNIIVDKSLQIQGIIDWEFTSTIPLQLFTPPSWITGHDLVETNKQMHVEFYGILLEKSKTSDLCEQLRREWYDKVDAVKSEICQTDVAFYFAHILRRPTDTTDIYCDFFAQKDSDKHLDDIISDFFSKHLTLASEVQHRAKQCERYTLYLKEHGLYETEEDRLLAQSKALKDKWGWS